MKNTTRQPMALLVVWLFAAAVQAQNCETVSTVLQSSPSMLHFDNEGQSFVSVLYQDDITALLETTRRAIVCRPNDAPSPIGWIAHAFIGFRLQYANAYVLHEYAHAEVARSLGMRHVHVGIDKDSSVSDASYTTNLIHMAFEPQQLFNMKRRSVGVYSEGTMTDPVERVRDDAAGLNLNSYFGQHHFAAMIDGDNSPSRALAYTVNKWFSPVYFELDKTIGGDPSAYLTDLAQQGIQTSKQAIQRYQLAAALLSNGTWTSLGSLGNYAKSSGNSSPLGWRVDNWIGMPEATLYWPEFSTFLNTSGASLASEVTLDLRNGGAWSLGLERNVIGQTQGTDVNLGVRKQFGTTRLSARLTGNAGHSFTQVHAQYRLTPRLDLTGLLYANHGDTLTGQRLAYRSKSGGYVGVNLYF